jgi:pimeloyl-ACP methyl ester carboxylesterase
VELRRHMVTLADGRELEVVEAGDKNSPAIIIHNGTPTAAGLIVEHVEDAVARGLRLINYGRPGYGRSTRQRDRTVSSVAADTAELADVLGIERFATWGISGGGPHALACAALLSDRVVAAACLAGVAPYDAAGLDFLKGMGEDNIVEFGAAAKGEAELTACLEPQVPAFLQHDDQEIAAHMSTLLSPADRAVFSGAFGTQLARSMQDAVRNGVYGWIDDDLAFVKPWGFSLASISVPLQIWQGSQDLMVPFSHGQWLAAQLPQAEAHLTAEDGHLTLYVHRIPEVHAWLAEHF